MELGVDNPLGTQQAGALPFLSLAVLPDPAFPCGTTIPGFGMSAPGAPGELLVDLFPLNLQFGPPWAGPGTPASFQVLIPPSAELIGLSFFAQGGLIDPTGGGVPVGLTDALSLRIRL